MRRVAEWKSPGSTKGSKGDQGMGEHTAEGINCTRENHKRTQVTFLLNKNDLALLASIAESRILTRPDCGHSTKAQAGGETSTEGARKGWIHPLGRWGSWAKQWAPRKAGFPYRNWR